MRRLPTPLTLLAGLLALYLVAPLIAGLANIGTADWAGTDGTALVGACLVSVASASAATLLVALGGIPLAFVLSRRSSPGWALLGFVVQLPLALPPLSSGILLLFLLGYASPLGRLTGGQLTESFLGIVLAEAFVAAPFLIIAARSAFGSLDRSLEDAVATLGHGPSAVFRRVSLPLAGRAIVSGLLLTWLRAFGEFGATVMVAYHPYSLPVYTYVAFGERGLPAMLPVLAPTLIIALALSVLAVWIAGRRWPHRATQTPLDPQPPCPQPAAASARTHAGALLDVQVRHSLGAFNLTVEWRSRARRLAVLGPSGSGKSALLRSIAGLAPPGNDRIAFDGNDLSRLPVERRNVAYVPQRYGLLPELPVHAQVRLAADCSDERANRWTERLGLRALEHRRSCDLSLGQQQRVAIARALARRSPRLVLLDEPFSALDAPLRAVLRAQMLDWQADVDATTLIVTHDPAEAMLLADELLLLDDGRVLQAGSVDEVFARPTNGLAARLLGAEPCGTAHVTSRGALDIGGGVVLDVTGPDLPSGSDVGWAVRAHQLHLCRQGGRYPATLTRRGPAMAGQRRVVVTIGCATLAIFADPGCPDLGPCSVDIDPAAIQVWPLRDRSSPDRVNTCADRR